MNPAFVFSLLIALPACPEPEALAMFRQWRKSPSPELRAQAVRTLKGHDGPAVRAALLSMLNDPHPAVRTVSRTALVGLKTAIPAAEVARLRSRAARVEGLRVLLARGDDPALLVGDKDPEVRARVLASGRAPPEALRAALRDPDGRARAIALEVLDDPVLAQAFVRDRAEEMRIAVARVANDAGILARLMRDRSWRVRLAAVRATLRVRLPGLVPALIGILDGEPGRVRARAAQTLEELTGAGFGENAKLWRAWQKGRKPGYEFPPPRPARKPGHSSARVTFRRIPVVSRRICFVLDASRSMGKPAPGGGGKSRWELVIRDLVGVLDRIAKGTRFNVVLFRTDVEAWRPRLVKATRAARKSCREWIGAAPPKGWTNLYDGVALALADDDVDAIYILTDGVPSRGTETTRTSIHSEIAFLNR